MTITMFESLFTTAASNGGTQCMVSGNMETTGTLYTAAPSGDPSYPCCGYVAGIDVANALPADSSNDGLVTLDTLSASYSFTSSRPSAAAVVADSTSPLAVTIPSGGSSTVFVATLMPVANGSVLAGLSGTLAVHVTLSGHSNGGAPISAQATFPIDVVDSAPSGCQSPETVETCNADSADQADGFACVSP